MFKLKDSDFQIWASIADPEFDNDDSEYATIKLKYYSNLETQNNTYPDEDIPMKKCENLFVEENVRDLWYPGNVYCPDFSENHFLKATYRHNLHSWLRLVVYRCDPAERLLIGKSCKSDEEINEWLYTNIFSAQIQKQAPNIDKNELSFTKKYFVDINFQHPNSNYTVYGQEISILRNKVILEDGILGIIDKD